MTITAGDGPPSLAEAAARLGVAISDLNAAFGVVPIDPARHLYCVEVRADRLPQEAKPAPRVGGPFSNPQIAPMGLAEPAVPVANATEHDDVSDRKTDRDNSVKPRR
jgi:hypothetical protein